MDAVLRVLAAALCAAALASLTAGCSGASNAADARLRSATTPVSPQAKAYAKAVNLRAADVPGITEEPGAGEGAIGNGLPLGALDRCVGDLGRSALADAPILSSWFIAPKSRLWTFRPRVAKEKAAPGELIYSEIDVMRDEASAIREVAALGTARARVCLKNHPKTSHGKPSISNVEVYPLTPDSAHLPVTDLRMAGTLRSSDHTKEAFYYDVIGATSGRSAITLHVASWQQPFPVRNEQRLMSLLLQRASKHQV
jgi:hypothetical protein